MYNYVSKTTPELDYNIFTERYGHGVSWAVEYIKSDGKTVFDHTPAAACWAGMRECMAPYAKPDITPVALWGCLHASIDTVNVVRPYWNFIFDKDNSPWRSLLGKGQGFDWESPLGLKDAKTKYSYVKIPITKKTNMQTLVNLLMAARVGADIPSVLHLFTKLTEEGWPEIDAFYVSTYVGLEGTSIIDLQGRDHYAFSARYNNVYQWMKDGTPKPDEKLTLGHNYRLTQSMWYADKAPENPYAIPKIKDTKFSLALNGKKRVYDGLFPRRFVYTYGTKEMAKAGIYKLKDFIAKREQLINAVSK